MVKIHIGFFLLAYQIFYTKDKIFKHFANEKNERGIFDITKNWGCQV